MTIFFSSDFHFCHTNICAGTSKWDDTSACRQFKTIDEMNQKIIDNINLRVDPDDVLYCLGDFAFGGVKNYFTMREQINCNRIHLILGNHDGKHGQDLDPVYNGQHVSSLFGYYDVYREISLGKQKFVLFHYPISSWNSMSRSIHLHGHTHRSPQEKFKNGGKSMDVGVDGNNYMPYSLEEIMEIMKDREVLREGHH